MIHHFFSYSQSYPNQFSYSIAHIPNENDFWNNRTLLLKSPFNQIEFESFTNSDQVFSLLFNQSYLIPYQKQNEKYFLQNFNQFSTIKNLILINPIFRQFKINIRSEKIQTNQIDMDLIVSNTTRFHIKFGSTYEEEFQRLVEENLSQMSKKYLANRTNIFNGKFSIILFI